jgi:hypothetical protein
MTNRADFPKTKNINNLNNKNIAITLMMNNLVNSINKNIIKFVILIMVHKIVILYQLIHMIHYIGNHKK